MKIGVLTVPFNNNYGGFLQAYSLKTILERMGHDVVFIDRKRNKIKRPLWKALIGFPYFKFKEIKAQNTKKKISIFTDVFKQKYLAPFTPEYYCHEDLKTCLTFNFDAFIVGSDQVWRYKYAKKSIDDYFFSFLEDTTPKFSYAASFGTSENEYPLAAIEKCRSLLKSFVSISVREYSGKEMLSRYFDVNPDLVNVVLDPTLLLTAEDYRSLFSNIATKKEPYVCSYILDASREKSNLISSIAQKYDGNVVYLKAQTNGLKDQKPIEPVEKWLYQMASASFVVTDSFHGTVFSIIFNKPFIVIANNKRGNSRFETLLTELDLKSRYIKEQELDKIDDVFLFKPIEWEIVNSKMDTLRNLSLNFLAKSLNLCELNRNVL